MRALRMASVWCLVGVAIFWPRPAGADCGDTYIFVYPGDGATQVPTNARVVLSSAPKGDVILAYDDAPSVPIAGKTVMMGGLVLFVPDNELAPNKALTLKVGAYPQISFETGSGPDTTSPSLAGMTALELVEGTVKTTQKSDAGAVDMTMPDGGGCGCGGGTILTSGQAPEPEGSVFDLFEVELGEATDNTSPTDALIYKVFTYSTPGTRPAEPAAVLMGQPTDQKIHSACGRANECAVSRPGPFPSFDFALGQTACVAIDVEDPAGNVTSLDESCGVVEAWEVDGYCALLAKTPSPEPDGGTGPPPDGGQADAAVTDDSAGSNADVATEGDARAPSNAPDEDGCSCAVPASRGGGLALLLLALLLVRRRA